MAHDEYRAPGLGFLMDPCGKTKLFCAEYFSEEQKQMYQEARRFVENTILPIAERIDAKEEGLLVANLKKAGELGFLMIDVPEQYGGLGMDKATGMLVTEAIVPSGSFAVGVLTHTGIGTLPIVFFGTEEQKETYLPKLATGELIGCYGLTEAGSGSDALGAKTKAVLDPSGTHYVLNGEKVFITNAGFADIITAFAKVDGDKFTAFIVDMRSPGLSTGAEEHKMGIHGSSTRSVIFEDVKVPVGNVLGEVGKGHRVAFNILNVGRFKLGAGAVGAAKKTIEVCAKYAKERVQFKRPIATFGAIREKLARMAMLVYSTESMTYRTAGLMDSAIELIDKSQPGAQARIIDAIEEYAIEQSIMKVYGSEAFSECIDEGVQIHGGYGYIAEYFVERGYRDSRVNRIFEGTNEINRLLIPGTLMKRVFKGKFPLAETLMLVDEIAAGKATMPGGVGGPLGEEAAIVDRMKLAVVFAVNQANTKHMMDLMEHKKGQTQMAMLKAADAIMEAFAGDSAVARARQLIADKGEAKAAIPVMLTRMYLAHALTKVRACGQELLVNTSDEKDREKNLATFNLFIPVPPWQTHDMKEKVAAHVIEREAYALE